MKKFYNHKVQNHEDVSGSEAPIFLATALNRDRGQHHTPGDKPWSDPRLSGLYWERQK
jgi:hypothetical protein